MGNLKEYEKIVGKDVLAEIQTKVKKLRHKHIVSISSTYQGGGVAEILNSIVILFNRAGLDFGWRILHGSHDFFKITKKFHNALQGQKIHLTQKKKNIYYETNKRFSEFTHIGTYHDLVVVHDPQPLPMIDFYKKKQPWIFRCHIDLSQPNLEVWNYLKKFIKKYDHFIVTKENYKKKLRIPQLVMRPAIDPLSIKNRQVSDRTITKYLSGHDIKQDKPIISQISRFDRWKDHTGTIRIFESVRKKVNCQLVLLGSFASDDPEGQKIYGQIKKKVEKSNYKKDIKLLLLHSDILVNCLQRASAVVFQKSLKEGFGLTVSEALYKGTPVVASNVGGIPLQIINGMNGFIHEPKDFKGFVASTIKLLKDENLRTQLGKRGKEYVRDNFLITRLMLDWLNLFGVYLAKK
ncbi:glycosyl transferase family 1 [Candidatus Woesearchaeota archaeon]|nr:MAG: glycosyl transferase family 1 [Candidatus Woesearchaeota archaeon]